MLWRFTTWGTPDAGTTKDPLILRLSLRAGERLDRAAFQILE